MARRQLSLQELLMKKKNPPQPDRWSNLLERYSSCLQGTPSQLPTSDFRKISQVKDTLGCPKLIGETDLTYGISHHDGRAPVAVTGGPDLKGMDSFCFRNLQI